MRDQIITIRIEVRLWIFFHPLPDSLIHIPIRGIDGYAPDLVLVFFQEASEAVAFFGCISLLQKRIAEQLRALSVGGDDRFVAEKICREFAVRDSRVCEHEMGIGMIADEVTGIVPFRDKAL